MLVISITPSIDHYPLIRRGGSEVNLDETVMVSRQLGTRILPCFFMSIVKNSVGVEDTTGGEWGVRDNYFGRRGRL